MKLSVLIPTVGDREDMLAQTEAGFRATVPGCEILIVYGYTWGEGLNQLVGVAQGDYWYTSCDDTVPLPGWFEKARSFTDDHLTPCPRYLNPDGSPLKPGWDDMPHGEPVDWARAYLLTPAIYNEVGPFIDATWYCDIDYSERLVRAGYPILACDGFAFTHLGGERSWRTNEVDVREEAAYRESHRRQGIV